MVLKPNRWKLKFIPNTKYTSIPHGEYPTENENTRGTHPKQAINFMKVSCVSYAIYSTYPHLKHSPNG